MGVVLSDWWFFGWVMQRSLIVSLGSINIIDAAVIEAKQSRKRKGRNGLALLRLNLNQ